jgi:hypothetical protein
MKRNKHDSTLRNSSNEDLPYVSTDDSDRESGDDAQCPFCHGLFCNDNKGETWIRCTNGARKVWQGKEQST